MTINEANGYLVVLDLGDGCISAACDNAPNREQLEEIQAKTARHTDGAVEAVGIPVAEAMAAGQLIEAAKHAQSVLGKLYNASSAFASPEVLSAIAGARDDLARSVRAAQVSTAAPSTSEAAGG